MNKSLPLIFGVVILGVLLSINGWAYSYNWTWVDLSATDTNDWADAQPVNKIAAVSTNGLIYTAVFAGRFGAYNATNNVWVNLTGTDPGDWYNVTNNMYDITALNGKVYCGFGTGRFGYYDPATNILSDLSATDTGNWISTTDIYVVTPIWDTIYLGLNTGKFGVYNITSNVTTDLSATDTGNWMSTSLVNGLTSYNGLVYTGGASGKFGVYNPATNIWSDLSATDTNNWMGTNQINSLASANNGLIYLGINAGRFGVYNVTSNVTSNLSGQDTGNWAGTQNVNYVHSWSGLIFTAHSNGLLGVYDPSNNNWTDLSTTDTGNWVSTTNVKGITSLNNMIYTGLDAGKFGVLNDTNITSTPVFSGIITIPANNSLTNITYQAQLNVSINLTKNNVSLSSGVNFNAIKLFNSTNVFNLSILNTITYNYSALGLSITKANDFSRPIEDSGVCYDNDSNELFLFPGAENSGCYSWGEVYQYNFTNSSWYNVTPSVKAPIAIIGNVQYVGNHHCDNFAGYAFDFSTCVGTATTQQWRWNTNTKNWTNITVASTVGTWADWKDICYNPATQTSYLYSGNFGGNFAPNTNLYIWNHTNLNITDITSLQSVNRPSARMYSFFYFDAINQKCVLIGGEQSDMASIYNDTWTLDISTYNWVQNNITFNESFVPRANGWSIVLPTKNLTALFGGRTSYTISNATNSHQIWTCNATNCNHIGDMPDGIMETQGAYIPPIDAALTVGGKLGATFIKYTQIYNFTYPYFSTPQYGYGADNLWHFNTTLSDTILNGAYSLNVTANDTNDIYIFNLTSINALQLINSPNFALYNVTFPYANNAYTDNNTLTYGFTTSDPNYNYTKYNLTALTGDGITCYQGLPNATTTCGSSNTGNILIVPNYLYLNYTVPSSASSNSKWQVKYGQNLTGLEPPLFGTCGSNCTHPYYYNVTIPSGCWNNPLQLRFYSSLSTTHAAYGQCYNGTGWQTITIISTVNILGSSMTALSASDLLIDGDWNTSAVYSEGDGDWGTSTNDVYSDYYGARIFEQGMIWRFNDAIIDTNATSITFSPLPDGKYYYGFTVYDVFGNNHFYDPNITIDTIYPIITINNINNSIVSNSTILNITIQHIDNIANTTLNIYNVTGSQIILYNTASMQILYNLSLSTGTYYYNVTSTDISNQTGNSSTYTVNFQNEFQTSKYNVTFPYTNNAYTNNNTLTYGFTTTDPYYSHTLYNITGLNNLILYSYCYQESVNIANQTGIDSSCGLNYSGTFTDAAPYVYINYSKPSNITSAKWQIKLGNQNPTMIALFSNISIPESCFNYNSNILMLRLYSNSLSSVADGECYNGTWNQLVVSPNFPGGWEGNVTNYFYLLNDGDWSTNAMYRTPDLQWERGLGPTADSSIIYEEGMFWNQSISSVQVVTTNQSFSYTLPDGKYYYDLTIYDLANNVGYYDPNITIDTTNPSITYVSPTETNGSTIDTRLTINVSINTTDTNYNQSIINLYNASSLVDTYSSTQNIITHTFNTTANGWYYFNATAYDNANNSNSTQTYQVYLDYFKNNITQTAYERTTNATIPFNVYFLRNQNTTNYTVNDGTNSYNNPNNAFDGNNATYADASATISTFNSQLGRIFNQSTYVNSVSYNVVGHRSDGGTTNTITGYLETYNGSIWTTIQTLYTQTSVGACDQSAVGTYTLNANTYGVRIRAEASGSGAPSTYSYIYALQTDTTHQVVLYNYTSTNRTLIMNNLPKGTDPYIVITNATSGYNNCTINSWVAANDYVFPDCVFYNNVLTIIATNTYSGTPVENFTTNLTLGNYSEVLSANTTSVTYYLIQGQIYGINLTQSTYFSTATTYTPTNTSATLNLTLNQTQVTFRFIHAFDHTLINNTNISVYDITLGQTYNTTTGLLFFSPPAGTRNYTISAARYVTTNYTITINPLNTSIIDVSLFPILNISIYDEKLSMVNLTYFNLSSPQFLRYTIYCIDNNGAQTSTITAIIPNGTVQPYGLPTTCQFNRMRFDLQYVNLDGSLTIYNRMIIVPATTTAFDFKVYLPDLKQGYPILETILKPYDIYGVYTIENKTQVIVTKLMPTGTELITSDYIDAEGKITAYLIQGDSYILTILSDNAPARILGPYVANSEGTKILRLFDVSLAATATSTDTTVITSTTMQNTTNENQSLIIMHYQDTGNYTQTLTMAIINGTYDNNTAHVGCDIVSGPGCIILEQTLSYNQLNTSLYNAYMSLNVMGSKYNQTSQQIYTGVFTSTYFNGQTETKTYPVQYNTWIRMPAQFRDPWTFPWIVILLLVGMALALNVRTVNMGSLFIVMIAAVLYGWNWYATGNAAPGVAVGVPLAIALIIAIFMNIKKQMNTM